MSRQKVVWPLLSFVIRNDKAVQLLVGGAKARVGLGGGGGCVL